MRVPAVSGGRNVKCPGCSLIFTVPKPEDSSLEITTDDKLPIVAVEEEILEGASVPPKSNRPAPRESTARRPGTRTIPIRRANRAPWVLGGIGAGVVLVLGTVLLLRASGKKSEPKRETPVPESSVNPEIETLFARCREYFVVFHSGRHREILEFYEVPESDRLALRAAVTSLLEAETQYLNVDYVAADPKGDLGTVTFTCTYGTRAGREVGKRITWRWRKTGTLWKLAEIPRP